MCLFDGWQTPFNIQKRQPLYELCPVRFKLLLNAGTSPVHVNKCACKIKGSSVCPSIQETPSIIFNKTKFQFKVNLNKFHFC